MINGIGWNPEKESDEERRKKERDARIDKWNKDAFHLIWTILISMITAIATTILCKM